MGVRGGGTSSRIITTILEKQDRNSKLKHPQHVKRHSRVGTPKSEPKMQSSLERTDKDMHSTQSASSAEIPERLRVWKRRKSAPPHGTNEISQIVPALFLSFAVPGEVCSCLITSPIHSRKVMICHKADHFCPLVMIVSGII